MSSSLPGGSARQESWRFSTAAAFEVVDPLSPWDFDETAAPQTGRPVSMAQTLPAPPADNRMSTMSFADAFQSQDTELSMETGAAAAAARRSMMPLPAPPPPAVPGGRSRNMNPAQLMRRAASRLQDAVAHPSSAHSRSNSEAARQRALANQQHHDVFGPTEGRMSDATAVEPLAMGSRGPPGPNTRHAATRVDRPEEEQGICSNWWPWTARIVTCWIPTILMRRFGKMHDPMVQQAWREKMTLVMIAVSMWAILAFMTFAFTMTVCPNGGAGSQYDLADVQAYKTGNQQLLVVVHGNVYNMYGSALQTHSSAVGASSAPGMGAGATASVNAAVSQNAGTDFSAYFPISSGACANVFRDPSKTTPPCTGTQFSGTYCHDWNSVQGALNGQLVTQLALSWQDIENSPTTYIAYNGLAINVSYLVAANPPVLIDEAQQLLMSSLGTDATHLFVRSAVGQALGQCLSDAYVAGTTETRSVGCFASDIVLYVSFAIIIGVVVIRFMLALWFYWTMSRKLGSLRFRERRQQQGVLFRGGLAPSRNKRTAGGSFSSSSSGGFFATDTSTAATPAVAGTHRPASLTGSVTTNASGNTLNNSQSQFSTPAVGMTRASSQQMLVAAPGSDGVVAARPEAVAERLQDLEHTMEELYTVIMVPCYSEGREALRTTLDSLANTTYSDDRKLIVVVADGIVKGSDNDRSTPELLIDMVQMDPAVPSPPPKLSYLAIASGARRHNMAQVYVGHYIYGTHQVPTLLVIKCGTPDEATTAKPGNRGKRDSQLILMNFFQKVLFDERMSPLEFDLFNKIRYLCGTNADDFEVCLMVDADTVVAPDSLSRMVACMVQDPQVIGLCGETRISNKRTSFTTRIQVFEYYINHHLNKAFESVFGGVTCLPGCFCMYRIKTPKDDGFWVPILASPDIVTPYSVETCNTLHQKNLLLLGEDRFLTTLMLRTFPRRKMVFVPRAFCKTFVPDKFKVLLSQRRRWINSTVHNLLELVLVRELCGTFCFSMQFVLLLELIGSAVLPAAICFTILLIILSIVRPPVQILPLMLLVAILGLPALLIMLTTRKLVYVYWMLVYLVSLPIWNFVLPVYSFWHFDDFSWGETRKVAGEKSGGDKRGHGHGSSDDAAPVNVTHRRWVDWEYERRKRIHAALLLKIGERRRVRSLPPRPLSTSSSSSSLAGMSEMRNSTDLASMVSVQESLGASRPPSVAQIDGRRRLSALGPDAPRGARPLPPPRDLAVDGASAAPEAPLPPIPVASEPAVRNPRLTFAGPLLPESESLMETVLNALGPLGQGVSSSARHQQTRSEGSSSWLSDGTGGSGTRTL